MASLSARLARRFVAGETAKEAVLVARDLNQRGLGCILDLLGEDVSDAAGAEVAVVQYCALIEEVEASGLKASISIKLSQLGLSFDIELCKTSLQKILDAASLRKRFVWLDMEGSVLTDKTIRVFEAFRDQYPLFGLCLQAYLRRTPDDISRLAVKPVWIRLCKGAYKEPASLAYPTKTEVDAKYRDLAILLLKTPGVTPGFATHDETLLKWVTDAAKDIPRERFEFQMLYGIRNQRLVELAQEGYKTQVYVPFGSHWLPYFMRRIRERRENLLFVLRNLLRL